MLASGDENRTLLEGDCVLFYPDPRWVSETELVAARLKREAPGEYSNDLVKVDVATGAVTELVADGDLSYFAVSPSLGKISFQRRDLPTWFFVLDLATGQITEFADGYTPHLSGESRLI
jgi:hypothetical protein